MDRNLYSGRISTPSDSWLVAEDSSHYFTPVTVPSPLSGRAWLSGWITGFVDGEGCFSINFVRQPDRPRRRGYRTGYQVTHEFVVVQGISSTASMQTVKDFFDCGVIYLNKRYDNHKEHLNRYTVRRRDDLVEKIIPFFECNPLQTAKHQNFLKFRTCMKMIVREEHLTLSGLSEIVEIAQTMNHRRSRAQMLREIAALGSTGRRRTSSIRNVQE